MLNKVWLTTLALGLSMSAFADQWQSDDVDVSFLTTKVTQSHTTVTELNHFEHATATINADGQLNAVIDLGSVNSGIEIRDGRLKEFVFAAAKDLTLQVSGQIDLSKVASLNVGESITVEQPLHLGFGEQQVEVNAVLFVVRQSEATFSITTLKPILWDVSALAVTDGINKLNELAGLETIALQVPTLLHATFTHIE